MLARSGWPSMDCTWSSPSSSAAAEPTASPPPAATSAGSAALPALNRCLPGTLCEFFRVFTARTSVLWRGVQVTNTVPFRLRADSTFFVKKARNRWFQSECVMAVTLSVNCSARVGCSQFLKRHLLDAVGLVLQHDLGLVNIVSLHVI